MRTCKAVQSGRPKEFWISTFFTFWSATVIHTKKCLRDSLLLWIRLDLMPNFSWPQLVIIFVFFERFFLYKIPEKDFFRYLCIIDSVLPTLISPYTFTKKLNESGDSTKSLNFYTWKWRWFKFQKCDLLIFGLWIRKLLDFLSEIPGIG